jgi:cell division protein FtsB
VKEPAPGGWKRKTAGAAFIFLLLVLLMASFFGKKGWIEISRARKSHAALLQDIEGLKREKARLEKEVAALEKDPRAVDEEARRRLWLMKPDEKVVIRKTPVPIP